MADELGRMRFGQPLSNFEGLPECAHSPVWKAAVYITALMTIFQLEER